ncbi:PqiA/YebS family transporter subunit [Desulfobotulus mexicanus]|uniref:PqiA/YebS family transporter subunit n=1 Tax=Desulfobotulus mexicanus TaxID=2586642 RepID=A0A5S5MCX8_9BACT|nr:PqiA/YebS family transporter subunit [Desulfobotulus mexicanus]TYT73540.1 PqiA/YebS family transporter subunit [Desulfobotulus mexicanus]
MNTLIFYRDWIACPSCDRLHIRPRLLPGHVALCKSCGTRLTGRCMYGTALPLALCLTALVGWIIAMTLPFIAIGFGGQHQTISLPSAVIILTQHNMLPLAIFTGLLLIAAPLISILLLIYLLFFLYHKTKPPFYRFMLKAFSRIRFWDMTDVYLISIIVVLVKAMHMADIQLLHGFWAFCIQVFFIRFSFLVIPVRDMWQRLSRPGLNPAPLPGKRAIATGLVPCHTCTRIHKTGQKRCTRCASPLHNRIPQSINRTFALTITAFILYIPANLYPIMITENLGTTIYSTIIGGVILLWETKAYAVASIVFFASVFIPLAKLLALLYLTGSVYFRKKNYPNDLTKIYKITEFIGKWSMVDVFVVATLAAMIQMGSLATIQPGIAATAFAAMVVITLFAAETFDPRLLWDSTPQGKNNEQS